MSKPDNPLVFRELVPDATRRGDLVLNPRARFTKLDAQGRAHVAATEARVERMLSKHAELGALRGELHANAELSPLGRAKKLGAAGAELLESLAKESKVLTVAEALHTEKRAKLTAVKPLDRDDLAGAIRDMALVAVVHRTDAKERSKLFADPEVAAAVLRMPAIASGISQEAWSRLKERALAAQHGPALAALEAEGVAIGAWRETVDLVRDDVNRAVAAAEREAPEAPAA